MKWLLPLASLLLGGCNLGERLTQVGREPPLTPIESPTQAPGYRPVSMPMPAPEEVGAASPNSLWRTGARGFFKDQRARQVGDLLKVNVTIQDKASLKNETSRSRDNVEELALTDFFGLENELSSIFPGTVDPTSPVDLESKVSNAGKGNVTRNETIELAVAAVVVQVLPNGNLVIQGRQEVRVNFEVRQLYLAGVVRPEDITSTNTIAHDQIAELRVSYGGEGQLTDMQQPRYGAQVLDIILPF